MKKFTFTLSVILLSLTIGCQKVALVDDVPVGGIDNSTILTESVTRGPKDVVLGEKINNPYSVENMGKALDMVRDSLQQPNQTRVNSRAPEGVEIYPTNLYVRMCAEDSVSNAGLVTDSTLFLHDYPRDFKVKEPGDYYFDTIGVVDTRFQWWYATVPVDYKPLPGVKFEVIEELFIPENSIYFTKESVDPEVDTRSLNGRVMDRNFANCLTYASFYLTGNADLIRQTPEEQKAIATRASYDRCYECRFLWWTWIECRTYSLPKGRILVQTNNGVQPLKGVRVRVARWFEEDGFYTDQYGFYRGNRDWEHMGFDLEYKIVFQGNNGIGRWTQTHFIGTAAYYVGVRSLSGTSLVFYDNSHYWGRAVIHNAINDYMTKCSKDNNLTQLTNDMVVQVVEKFMDNSGNVNIAGAAFMGFPSTMWMEFYRKTWAHDQIVALAWHELSHAGHHQTMWNQNGYNYAVRYWNKLYAKQLFGYGKKGDANWDMVALAEGWANYCAYYFSNKYLSSGINLGEAKYKEYPRNYLFLFKELVEAGCLMSDLQKSISFEYISDFESDLISKYWWSSPGMQRRIEKIVAKYK